MSTPAIGPTSTPPTSPVALTAAIGQNSLANQNVFLQLLIAQLKNQNPENPANGAEFIAQLAQFTTLEQTTQSRSALDQIVKLLSQIANAATSAR